MPTPTTISRGRLIDHDRIRVLVVDDEASVAYFIARILRPWDVTVVSDGATAEARIEEGGWDVILCDLSLPGGIDGADLYRDADDEQRRRFLFITGGAYTPESEAFLASCHEPPLYKPFGPVELRARIERLVSDLDGPLSA